MRWMLSLAALLITGLLLSTAGNADYLEVRRSATIKELPVRDAIVIERPEVGSYIQLIDDGRKQNGYYRVIAPEAGQQGWIYRTLVRRYRGSLPGGPAVVQPGILPDSGIALNGTAMRAHFVDVGQGDAALLEFSCGAVLIDAGGFSAETTQDLVDYLYRFFEERPDLENTIETVFITHTHIDHNRALREIVENFTIKNYIHTGDLTGSGRHAAKWMVDPSNTLASPINKRVVSQADIESLTERIGLSDGSIDPVNCDLEDPQIRVLSGPYGENPGWPQGHFENDNNKSLVIRVDFGDTAFLFTGDLEEHAIETLVEYYHGTDQLDVDVYQVGHHGSANGTTESLMQAMTPLAAVLSMGNSSLHEPWTAWQYGHPRRAVVDLLDTWINRPRADMKWVSVAHGTKRFHQYRMADAIYGTGWSGTILITADSQGNFVVQAGWAPGS